MDDAGNQSQPADRQVIVANSTVPTAVLDGPRQVTQLQPFQLSAARSVGGIVRYQWTRMDGGREGPMPIGQSVVTETNSLTVAQSPTSYLGVGRHVLRLVVIDASGNQSKPADLFVEVVAPLPSGRSK